MLAFLLVSEFLGDLYLVTVSATDLGDLEVTRILEFLNNGRGVTFGDADAIC